MKKAFLSVIFAALFPVSVSAQEKPSGTYEAFDWNSSRTMGTRSRGGGTARTFTLAIKEVAENGTVIATMHTDSGSCSGENLIHAKYEQGMLKGRSQDSRAGCPAVVDLKQEGPKLVGMWGNKKLDFVQK